jgi:ABC-type transport system involved in multi-copper enzyme maturation permease subunit
MTFLPIVARELRIASRRPATYWIRTGAAGLILLLGAWFFLMMQREAPRELAMVLFSVTTGAAVLYCLLSGVRATSDCLSQEKREGTLGLLFLTDLKGYDVVLGKLVANSVNVFYAVLAVLPMLAIPLMMGGVTVGQYWRMALVAMNTLFFSLSVGIAVSSLSRDARRAAGWTFLVLILVTGLLPACAAWLAYAQKWPRLAEWLYLPSPGYSYVLAFDAFRFKPGEFWWSLGIIHGLAWLGLVVASLVVPRAWQDRPVNGTSRHRHSWSHEWTYGNTTERRTFRSRFLEVNPFFWLASRARLKPAYVWAVLGLLACGWVWGLAKFGRDWLNEGIYVTTGIVLNLLLKGWMASEAGRQLAEERQQGTLELLLSTPISVREILTGQRLALQRQFLGPTAFTILLMGLFYVAGRSEMNGGDRAAWAAFWFGLPVMLVADLVALYWVGMWQGVSAPNWNRAASTTVSRILVFPWVIIAVVLLLVALSNTRVGGPEPGWQFMFYLWFFVGIGTDIGFAAAARQKLLTEFREMATRRYETPSSWWKRVVRFE